MVLSVGASAVVEDPGHNGIQFVQNLHYDMTKRIPIELICAKDSSYAFSKRLCSIQGHMSPGLFESLDQSGILNPLLAKAQPRQGEEVQLIDGFKRYEWARKKGLSEVAIEVLPADFPDVQVGLFLAQEHFHVIGETVAAKALFISFAQGLSLELSDMVETILPAVGLAPHKSILDKYLLVSRLADDVLAFCHQKAFSIKRCINLSYYDPHLLAWLMGMKEYLHLTASVCEEILDAMNDIMKREKLSFEEVLEKEELLEVLSDHTLSPNQKTTRFRAALRHIRQPTLTGINEELEDWRRKLERRCQGLGISWDHSLEHDHINLNLTVTSLSQLQETLEKLEESASLEAIETMLERLRA